MALFERCTSAFGRRGLRALAGSGALVVTLLAANGTQDAVAVGESRTLSMVHSHTGESLTITYKSGGSFDSSALEKLNWFLRDWRIDEPISMSPHLFDVVWHVYRETGGREPIRIMSAYRSPGTNAMLRRRSSAVAKESQHMRGNAMDVHFPGVSMARAREIGLRLQRGGVGYYPSANSPFVHLDVGSVRHWPKMSRDQLERLFPDGKTVHIPADGKPLANYEAALAEVQARGGSALDYATVSSGKSLWALLFGSGDEDEEAVAAPTRGRGRAAASRVASARGSRTTQVASVNAYAGGSDNPMNPGYVAPAETAVSRPVAVAAAPVARIEPPRTPEPRSGLRDLDSKVPPPKTVEIAAVEPQRPAVPTSRFEPAGNVPLPPIRPQGAAFGALVASTDPAPLPPIRPAGLGAPVAPTAVAAAEPAPAPAISVTSAPGTAAPLPPARPEALRGVASLPGVIRSGESKLEPAASAQAYAAVQAPLPPQRHAALAPARVAAPALSAPALSAPALPKAQPPAPVLDAGRADARGVGAKPLAVPRAVAAAPAPAAAPLVQGFTAQKNLPTYGFSGSFVREIDAAGGFRRLGQ